jgi:hypothetical protein
MFKVSKLILILFLAFHALTAVAQRNKYVHRRSVVFASLVEAPNDGKDNQSESNTDAAEDISNIYGKMKWGDVCENFVSETDFGKWGNMIKNELNANSYPDIIKGSPDLSKYCPSYSSLSALDRENVWVLILNSIAFYESSCDDKKTARGPNGRLKGLLQLHVGREQLYAPNCKKGDGKSPQGTFRCGISMLNGQLDRGENLFSRKSYWDVLRPQGASQKYKKIMRIISGYPLCHQ